MSIFHSSWVYVTDVQLLIKEIFSSGPHHERLKTRKIGQCMWRQVLDKFVPSLN